MFVQQKDTSLVFIRSKYINAFPCGRRRSTLVDSDGKSETVSDRYYIPFNPEARLNTEANNRKHSGLNGFTQSYIYSWDYSEDESSGQLTLSIAGYLFEIQLTADYATPAKFGSKLEELFNNSNRVYANILLEDVVFFEGAAKTPEARTKILRNQTATAAPSDCLDILEAPVNGVPQDATDPNKYFFSGLSLSSRERQSDIASSLCLLKKSDGVWSIDETSRLPKIAHGDTPDSIKVGNVEAETVKLPGNRPLVTISIDPVTKQLQIATK